MGESDTFCLAAEVADVNLLQVKQVQPKGAAVTWTETFNCDVCGKQKSSTDHWWLAWTELYSPHPEATERHMFKIYPWENMLAHDANAKHLCGQACLQKLVDRWLNAEMGMGHASPHVGK